ncbi:tyrosine-type recombinase/integrase [Ligilactobacillus hayakitensis]|uniref:tyrosine-type recombinase/integrase n=1 Tax=Ligilactobacillus hayakitensis TaxID=396716 RepID=UPI0009DFF1A5|nr:tyrosine-type recombinase/integrase [Ligilactobacillus hayakitensis]
MTAHSFRHIHAFLLFDSGTNIKEVQERLEHSTSKMTLDICTHVTQNRKQETSLKFANFMQN